MPDPDQSLRLYSVHARHDGRRHARVLEEATFEAAAVAYAEDLADGREHCFTIDLGTGETEPCG